MTAIDLGVTNYVFKVSANTRAHIMYINLYRNKLNKAKTCKINFCADFQEFVFVYQTYKET